MSFDFAQDTGVDHAGTDIFVAEEFLNRADIPPASLRVNSAVLEEMGGKGVPKGRLRAGGRCGR